MQTPEEDFDVDCEDICQQQPSNVAVFVPLSFKDADLICKLCGSTPCSPMVVFTDFGNRISDVELFAVKNYYFLIIIWDGKSSIELLTRYIRQQRKRYFVISVCSLNM